MVALLELDIAVLVQMSLGREFHKAMVRSSKRFQSSNRDVYQVTLSQLFSNKHKQFMVHVKVDFSSL
jgi:hypothetical protein